MYVSELTYGPAKDAADYLNSTEVTVDDLVIALINALNRIHTLEQQVRHLQDER